jgi:hypothetical protein
MGRPDHLWSHHRGRCAIACCSATERRRWPRNIPGLLLSSSSCYRYANEAPRRHRANALSELWSEDRSDAERTQAVAKGCQFEPAQARRTSQDHCFACRLFGERQAVTERVADRTVSEISKRRRENPSLKGRIVRLCRSKNPAVDSLLPAWGRGRRDERRGTVRAGAASGVCGGDEPAGGGAAIVTHENRCAPIEQAKIRPSGTGRPGRYHSSD